MREIRLASKKNRSTDDASDSDDSSDSSLEDLKGDAAKEENFRLWHETLVDVPDDYDFVIRSQTVDYPAGA